MLSKIIAPEAVSIAEAKFPDKGARIIQISGLAARPFPKLI